jgi:hypothetical protein
MGGMGGFTGAGEWIAAGGRLPAVQKDATFALNADCSGEASFEFEGVPGAFMEKLVVFDHGKEMILISTSGRQIDMRRFTRMDK